MQGKEWGGDETCSQEEASRKLGMRMRCPCLGGMARPDPLSPVLVIKVMTVLLMPSLSREYTRNVYVIPG